MRYGKWCNIIYEIWWEFTPNCTICNITQLSKASDREHILFNEARDLYIKNNLSMPFDKFINKLYPAED
jgi:hypothetical protein